MIDSFPSHARFDSDDVQLDRRLLDWAAERVGKIGGGFINLGGRTKASFQKTILKGQIDNGQYPPTQPTPTQPTPPQ